MSGSPQGNARVGTVDSGTDARHLGTAAGAAQTSRLTAHRTSHPPDLDTTNSPNRASPNPPRLPGSRVRGFGRTFRGSGDTELRGGLGGLGVARRWEPFLALRPFLHPILKPFRGRYLPPRSADVYARTRAVIDLRLTAEQF